MIRRLRSEDIPFVTAMLRESFSRSLWPYMTYTQDGVGSFLDVAVSYPLSVQPRYLVVAADERSDLPLGFADFRPSDNKTALLSYICVDRRAQGQGLATQMFRSFLHTHPGLHTVALDTFRENARARSLYESWGFSRQSTAVWVTRAVPPAAEPLRIVDLPVSLAAHRAYGFCELRMDSPEAATKIGVLGESVVRCFDRDSFENDSLLASARGLLGGLTTAFAVLPEAVGQDLKVPHDALLLSDRMTMDLVQSGASS